jgi:hypothetical protein
MGNLVIGLCYRLDAKSTELAEKGMALE